MGGGDLNMKKSWHPLLLKNQERVWLEEKKALEEKKKLDQLRKELEEERQLQELQRLQEEQTGKKRSERLEWMYATPATGSSTSTNDLEDYLLGKKRVDKMLIGDENAKASPRFLGASHKNFIAVQNANTARDTASKIRDDPLFAIKQQEQAAYQALLSNPLRLRELQERNGIKVSKKLEKQARKEAKAEKRKLKLLVDEREEAPYRSRPLSRSRSPPSRYRSSSRSPRRRESSRRSASPRRHSYVDDRRYRRRASPSTYERDRPRNHRHRRSHSPLGSDRRFSVPLSAGNHASTSQTSEDDRAARLADMTASAGALEVERRQRLEAMLQKEKEELEKEDRERARLAKIGVGGFLEGERRRVYAGGLEGGLAERIKRGRATLVGVD
ncbi:hypothetical protein Clacol_003922 [Clathrus columnatus]|uniref:CBF1-interacting co-repressor CIR N-terminal domain-containing protein n=1 Tax=Clathrus columnatus TaxID=1419009 RepID=A0AAV5A961_9AGAM|nr:hypothetical protein Clacol_003922 [Clathrus columnatus]